MSGKHCGFISVGAGYCCNRNHIKIVSNGLNIINIYSMKQQSVVNRDIPSSAFHGLPLTDEQALLLLEVFKMYLEPTHFSQPLLLPRFSRLPAPPGSLPFLPNWSPGCFFLPPYVPQPTLSLFKKNNSDHVTFLLQPSYGFSER